MYALIGERVAVEQRNQIQGAAHVAVAIENEKKIGGRVGGNGRVGEFQKNIAKLIHGDVLQEDQVQHELIVIGNILRIDLRLHADGLLGNVAEGENAIYLALLHHAES